MIDLIVGVIIVASLGAAIAYIVRAKKKGAKCIGCPASDCCSTKHGAAQNQSEHKDCGCGCHTAR